MKINQKTTIAFLLITGLHFFGQVNITFSQEVKEPGLLNELKPDLPDVRRD